MKAAVAALILCMRVTRALRDPHTRDGFSCPEYCLECCPVHFGFVFDLTEKQFRPGVDDLWFKCIVKQSKWANGTTGEDELEEDRKSRDCNTPEKWRKGPSATQKTKCKFTPDEVEGRGWDTLRASRCTKAPRCCCDADDGWASTCLTRSELGLEPDHKPEKLVELEVAGEVREFVLKNRQEWYNGGECVQKGGQPEGVGFHRKPTSRSDQNNPGEGCCLKTKVKSAQVSVGRLQGHTTGPKGERIPIMRYADETVKWKACAKFQTLHVCSDDGGITPNGKVAYERAPRAGTCMFNSKSTVKNMDGTNELTSDGGCPARKKTASWCKCDEYCGE